MDIHTAPVGSTETSRPSVAAQALRWQLRPLTSTWPSETAWPTDRNMDSGGSTNHRHLHGLLVTQGVNINMAPGTAEPWAPIWPLEAAWSMDINTVLDSSTCQAHQHDFWGQAGPRTLTWLPVVAQVMDAHLASAVAWALNVHL